MDVLRQSPFLFSGPLLATFLLVSTTLGLLLWYSSRRQSYWKKIGLPYVEPLPIFGSALEITHTPIHEVELARYNKFGRVYGHYEGNRPVISVGEPEILRNILLKDFPSFTGRRVLRTGDKVTENMVSVLQGEDWKRVRSIITPTFSTGKIKRMLGIFRECSKTLVKNFREASEKGKTVDAKSIYGAFTMDVIASSAFSTKIDSHNDPNNKFVATAKDVFAKRFNWRFALFTLMPGFMKIFKIPIFEPAGIKFFSQATLDIIKERKRTGQTRNDFLQLLMDTAKEVAEEENLNEKAEDDITEFYGKVDNSQIWKSYYEKKTLSHEELVANCVIFFLAGYDTTASTLSFTSYQLALNPDIQEKLIEEVDNALRANKGELTYEAIQGMKCLDNVIAETLRLHPPAVRLERVADEDYKVEDLGLTIPKGMIVTIPVYAMHRDPKLFPNPEKFDPDRFSQEERSKQIPNSYLPFGAGPRNCVGMRFALMEVKVCLAYVLSNFRIKRCSETKEKLDYGIGQLLLQPKSIKLSMEIRKDAVATL